MLGSFILSGLKGEEQSVRCRGRFCIKVPSKDKVTMVLGIEEKMLSRALSLTRLRVKDCR